MSSARSRRRAISRPGCRRHGCRARDPIALRALVLILAVATFVAAGGERARRIVAAFDWQGVVVPANFRLDAWVSPPTIPAKPPVILPGMRPGEQAQARRRPSRCRPAACWWCARAARRSSRSSPRAGSQEAAGDQRPQVPAETEEHRFTITDRGTATVRGSATTIVWAFNAIPDRAPTIELTKDPEPQARGAVPLSYKLEDDYGVIEAQATFALKDGAGSSASRRVRSMGRPTSRWCCRRRAPATASAQTIKDLSEHPWAGADVVLTLIARDEAGNEGRSAAVAIRLPERVFQAAGERADRAAARSRARCRGARPRADRARRARDRAGEIRARDRVYLGLRSIYWNLAQAKTDDHLRDVVQRLWSMATQLEDGNVSDAEARLRQAQDALRQALERGASDEEIKKLTEELRAALDKFLQALAEEMRKNPQQKARRIDPNARSCARRTSRA